MFGKKKNNINKVVVSSKEELKTAIKRKEPYIEVQGDLAKKMKWMGKLSSVKIAAIIALLTSLAAVPGGGVLTCQLPESFLTILKQRNVPLVVLMQLQQLILPLLLTKRYRISHLFL